MPAAKPVLELTAKDFADFPIWAWAIDGEGTPSQDGSFVRPAPGASVPQTGGSVYLVAASAVLADGTPHPACVQLSRTGKIVDVYPMIVFASEEAHGLDGTATSPALKRIPGLPRRGAAYPMRWKLDVLVEGERRHRRGVLRHDPSYHLVRQIFRLIRSHGARS